MPRPRDFTSGKFKLRTTPSGMLPTDDDLKRVVRLGMPYSSMPPWPKLSDAEVDGVVQYLKTFYEGFTDPAQAGKPIALPQPPAASKASVEKGKELYASLGCVRCHGEAGRGEGPSAPTLKDDLGNPLRAADLTRRWTFRGGPTTRGRLPHLQHRSQRDADAVVLRFRERSRPLGAHRLRLLARRRRRAGLRDAARGAADRRRDRCREGRGALRGLRYGALPGRRADHGAGPGIRALRERGRAARRLRRAAHRVPGPLARHAGRHLRQQPADTRGAPGGGGAGAGPRGGRRRGRDRLLG